MLHGALAVASKEHVLYNVHAVKNIIFIFNASIAHRCFIVAMITGFLLFSTFSKRIEKDVFIQRFLVKI